MRWTSLKISLLVVLSFSMTMILGSFLFYKNLNVILGFWNKDNRMSIYLKAEANEADKDEILKLATTFPAATDAVIVTREAAVDDFTKMFGQYSAGMVSVDDLMDLVPESVLLKIPIDIANSELKKIKAAFAAHPLVEEVSYGGEWLSKFARIDKFMKIFGLSLFIILSLTVTFISALMVRSLVDESKSEIEVLSLIGATRWHIYWKYLKQFMKFFSLSLVACLGLTYTVFYLMKHKLLPRFDFQFIANHFQFLSISEIVLILGGLFAIVLVGACISLRSTIQKLSLFSYE